jgi:hypothetical protein
MSVTCFLFDEHIPNAIMRGLRRREPDIQIFRIGGAEAPAISTDDADLLKWIEEHDCLLITRNRASMPIHLRDHLTAGHHVPDILHVPKRLNLGEIIDELHLIWVASLPGVS